MEDLLLWKRKYLHHLELEKALSPHSLRAIEHDLEAFFQFAEGKLEKYQVKSYLFFLQEENFSPRTIQRKMSSLKGLLRYLKEKELLEEDLTLYLQSLPKEEEEIHAFSLEDWQEFRRAFEGNLRDRAMFELLYSTGLKLGEFLKLSYLQLDFDKQEIHLFQKGEKRLVFFSRRAKEALLAYCKEENLQEGPLWKLSEQSFRHRLELYKEEGSLPPQITMYSFRHSFALALLRGGMPEVEVKYLLALRPGASLAKYRSYLEKEKSKIWEKNVSVAE